MQSPIEGSIDGFLVDSIRELLRLSDHPDMACDEAHAIWVAHLDDVRHKIARLRSLEKELDGPHRRDLFGRSHGLRLRAHQVISSS